jgi:hypothetical protein
MTFGREDCVAMPTPGPAKKVNPPTAVGPHRLLARPVPQICVHLLQVAGIALATSLIGAALELLDKPRPAATRPIFTPGISARPFGSDAAAAYRRTAGSLILELARRDQLRLVLSASRWVRGRR